MKKLKRIVASLLSVLMVLSCCTALFSLVAFAEDTVLVSRGKSYTITGCGKGYKQYDTSLTDGVAKETLTYGADEWFGFYYSKDAAANEVSAPNGIGSAVIDLGEVVEGIDKLRAHICNEPSAGIGAPKSIKASVSEDGVVYTEVGSFESPSANGKFWVELALDNAVSARYVKFTFELSGVFAFVNELEVYGIGEESEPVPVPVTITANYNYNYAAGDITMLVPWTMGATLEAIQDKQYEWFNVAVLAWDAAAGAYKVTYVGEGTTRKEDCDFGPLEIPEYGFILASHDQAGANHEAVIKLKEGDTVYIYGENLTATAWKTAITATVTTAADDSKTAFAPQIPVTVNAGYNYLYDAGVTTLSSWKMGATLGDINAAKDHNSWNVAVLAWDVAEGVYKIAGVYEGKGAGTADHRSVEIPEYGFLLGAHMTADAYSTIAGLNVGDVVYIYGEDLLNDTKGTAITATVTTVADDSKTAFAPEIPTLSIELVEGDNVITVNPGMSVADTDFDKDLVLAIANNWNVDVIVNGIVYRPNRMGQLTADLPAGKNTVVFENSAEEAVEIVVTISEPLFGDDPENPVVITALGNYTANVTENHTGGVYYEYISKIDGKLTITINTESDWFYYINNETTYKYGDWNYAAYGAEASATIDVSVGDKVTFCVATDDGGWVSPVGTVDFSLSFDAWSGEKITVDGKNTGAWQSHVGRHDWYEVNYAKDENNLYVEIDYHGTLNGTAGTAEKIKFGNGEGTMIRLWFHDADAVIGGKKAMSYTNFMDISYCDGAIVDRFLVNTNAEGNNATVVYNYNDGVERPYTIENTLGENSWVMKLTMPLSAISVNGNVQFQPTVSNKDAELANDALYYGRRVLYQDALGLTAWYWDSDSALPATMGNAAFGWESVEEGVLVENVAVGAIEYGTPATNASYKGSLTDGVVPAAGYNGSWRAITLSDYDKIGYQHVIIDLGKVRSDIVSVGTWYWSANQSGIAAAKAIKFYASVDGVHWLDLGSPDLSDELHTIANWNPVWETVEFDTYLTARYIKMEVEPAKQFAFFGEIAVNAPASFDVLSSVGYAADDLNIMVPFEDEEGTYNTPKTISNKLGVATGGKDYNYYSLIVVDADNEVIATYKKLQDTTHGDVVIPEGGYLIGMHGTHAKLAAFQKITVGDTIVLKGTYDVNEFAGVRDTALEGISFYYTHTHNYVENVVPATCAKEGYTSCECGCGDSYIKEGSVVPATGNHVHESNVVYEGDVTVYEYKCSVCGGEVYYRDANGKDVSALKVSHNNRYNWSTFESMIISEAGKTCQQATNYAPDKAWIVYVVENVNGNYVATEYYKDCDEVLTLTAPEGGFLWYVCAKNSAYNAALDGALLNRIFVPADEDVINTSYAQDTNADPSLAKFIYAVEAPDASITGDINGDGVVNTNDLVELAEAIANGVSNAACDVDGDGIVNTNDLVELALIIAG